MPRDFYCVEIYPHWQSQYFRADYITFVTVINKKSKALPESLIVTAPELQEFLHQTPEGAKIRQMLEASGKSHGVSMGFVHAAISPQMVNFTRFYPLGTGDKFVFERLLRRKRIGSLIEAKIFRYIKERFPGMGLSYGYVVLHERDRQIAKRQGKENYSKGTVEEEYGILKRWLKSERGLKNYMGNWRRRAKANKVQRFGMKGPKAH